MQQQLCKKNTELCPQKSLCSIDHFTQPEWQDNWMVHSTLVLGEGGGARKKEEEEEIGEEEGEEEDARRDNLEGYLPMKKTCWSSQVCSHGQGRGRQSGTASALLLCN